MHTIAGIEDYDVFIALFTTCGRPMRRKHGFSCPQMYRRGLGLVRLLFEWEGGEWFDALLVDPTVKETMKSKGTTAPPKSAFVWRICATTG